MAGVITKIGGRKEPFSITEHVDSYVVPAGYYARVYVKDTAVRKETSSTGLGHTFLGLTIDGDEAFPVLTGWVTDFDGGDAAGETYVSLETGGIVYAWANSTAITFGRLNRVNNSDPLDVAPLFTQNLTADDQNQFWVQKNDTFYIPGSSNLNADIQYITQPHDVLPGEFWVPAGSTLETGNGNGSAFNLQYIVELYEE